MIIGSDSGKVSIVEFDTQLNDWKVLHCEVFGKTGCRRIVPGQSVAADPKGRPSSWVSASPSLEIDWCCLFLFS